MAARKQDRLWDYIFVAVDVERHEDEDIRRQQLVQDLSAALESSRLTVRATHPNWDWESLAGLPRRKPKPNRPGQVVLRFELLTGIGFVLVAGASGIIGNRTDGAVMTLVRRLRERQGRTAGELSRETALRRAQSAVVATWPEDVDLMHADALAVDAEERAADGSWEFRMRYLVPIDVDRRGDWVFRPHPWIYEARVVASDERRAIATAVRRYRMSATGE